MAQKTVAEKTQIQETEDNEGWANYLAIWLIGQMASKIDEDGGEYRGVFILALRKAEKMLEALKP